MRSDQGGGDDAVYLVAASAKVGLFGSHAFFDGGTAGSVNGAAGNISQLRN